VAPRGLLASARQLEKLLSFFFAGIMVLFVFSTLFHSIKRILYASLPMNPGQFRGQGSRRCHRPFPAVGSAGWTIQIVLSPVILQKKTEKSTRSLSSSLRKFCKKTLSFSRNQPADQQCWLKEICK